MKLFSVEIYTPSEKVYEGKAGSIKVPGTLGSFQVLYNHAPIISSLGKGKIQIKEEQETIEYETSGGTIEVADNKAILLLETAEQSH